MTTSTAPPSLGLAGAAVFGSAARVSSAATEGTEAGLQIGRPWVFWGPVNKSPPVGPQRAFLDGQWHIGAGDIVVRACLPCALSRCVFSGTESVLLSCRVGAGRVFVTRVVEVMLER